MTIIEDPTYAVVGNRLHTFPAACGFEDAHDLTTMSQAEVDERERLYGGFDRCEHCFGTSWTTVTTEVVTTTTTELDDFFVTISTTTDPLTADPPEDAP